MLPSSSNLRRLLAASVMLAVMGIPTLAVACPMCKEALGSNGGDLVAGFFYSILFMLLMPFLILGGISSYLYLLVRRARAERQLAASAVPVAAQSLRSAEETVGV